MERAGHDAKPALHAFHFMENNDPILDLDRLFPAVMRTGAAAGTEPWFPDRLLDTGDSNLVETLTLAAVRAGRDGYPNFHGQLLAEKFFIDLQCESNAVDDTKFAVAGSQTGGDIHDFFPLGTKWRTVRCEVIDETLQFFRVNMRELHSLTGGEMDVLDSMPGCDLAQSLHLGGGEHTGRHAEADNAEIGIAFGDDPAAGVNVLFDA
jgi:hypothetical protein